MCYSYSDIMCGFKGSFEKNNLNLLEMYKFYCVHAYSFQLCIINLMFMWTNCHPGTLSMHRAVSEKIFKPLNPIHHELNFSLWKEMKVSKPMFELDLLHVLITADIISFNKEKYTLDAWSSVSFLFCTFPLASNNQPPSSLVHLLYWCSVLVSL